MTNNKGTYHVACDTVESYNIISICAGYGGLDLAVGLAVENARTVCHVEREAQAAAGLASRMEDGSLHEAPVWSDLSTFDGKPWRGLVDCIISGDPCQPNSVAGSQRGAEDDRFLIDQLIRVIKEVRPSRVFRENVTGNADGQLAALIPALEELGYSLAGGIFSAGEVGASHQRERLFIMADAKSIGHRSGRKAGDIPEAHGRQDGKCLSIPAVTSDVVADAECPERRPSEPAGNVANGETAKREEAASWIGASNEKLANPESRVRRLGETERRKPQGHIAGGSGELANANRLGHDLPQRNEAKQSGDRPKNGVFIGDGGDLADASLRRRRGESYDCVTPKQPNQISGRIFAPGPSDVAWQSIVASSPFLAPSLAGLDVAEGSFTQAAFSVGAPDQQKTAKSVFRGVANGLASRVDRLRGAGNGVCSMAGAIAWLSLANHFEGE